MRIDGEVVEDPQRVFAPGFEGVLQVGKRNFARVRLVAGIVGGRLGSLWSNPGDCSRSGSSWSAPVRDGAGRRDRLRARDKNRPAGFRTHMLVAGAAALLVGLGP